MAQLVTWEYRFYRSPLGTPPEQITVAVNGLAAEGWEPFMVSLVEGQFLHPGVYFHFRRTLKQAETQPATVTTEAVAEWLAVFGDELTDRAKDALLDLIGADR